MKRLGKSAELARLGRVAHEAYKLAREIAANLPTQRRTSMFGLGHDELDQVEHLLSAAKHLALAAPGSFLDQRNEPDIAGQRGDSIGYAKQDLRWLLNQVERHRDMGRSWMAATWIERLTELARAVDELEAAFPRSRGA